jgi:hypothetical protein
MGRHGRDGEQRRLPRFHKDLRDIIQHRSGNGPESSRRKSAQGMGLQRPKARIGEGSVLKSKFFFEIGFLLIELYLFGFALLGK